MKVFIIRGPLHGNYHSPVLQDRASNQPCQPKKILWGSGDLTIRDQFLKTRTPGMLLRVGNFAVMLSRISSRTDAISNIGRVNRSLFRDIRRRLTTCSRKSAQALMSIPAVPGQRCKPRKAFCQMEPGETAAIHTQVIIHELQHFEPRSLWQVPSRFTVRSVALLDILQKPFDLSKIGKENQINYSLNA